MSSHPTFQITLKLFLMAGSHLLVLRDQKSQTGDLPGGRITGAEFTGPWHSALERELREELGTGLRAVIRSEPLFVFDHLILEEQAPALGIAFQGSYLGGPLTLSDEHDHFEWVELSSYEPEGFFASTMARAVRRFQKCHEQ